jgi:hypothetical protein
MPLELYQYNVFYWNIIDKNKKEQYRNIRMVVIKKIYIPISQSEFPIHIVAEGSIASYIDKYGEESYFASIFPEGVQVFSKKLRVPSEFEDDVIHALMNVTNDTERIVVLSKIYDIDPTLDNAQQLLGEIKEYHSTVLKGNTESDDGKQLLKYVKILEKHIQKKGKGDDDEEPAKEVTEKKQNMPEIGHDNLLFSQGSRANRLELQRYIPANRKQFPSFIQMEFEPRLAQKDFLPLRVWIPDHNQFANKTPFEQQKFVSYFLSDHTPYRGLLLYHGLGSGKSGASILIAEGFRDRRVAVLLPASLHNNYISEIKKFGEAAYKQQFYWEFVELPYDAKKNTLPMEVVTTMEGMGIAEDLLYSMIAKHGDQWGIFMIDYKKTTPNYDELSASEKRVLDNQISTMIDYKYAILHYNAGIFTIPQILEKCLPRGMYRRILLSVFGVEKKTVFTQSSLSRMMDYVYNPANKIPNPFDNRVVIIDEVHNVTSHLTGQSYTIGYIYEMIMRAKDVKLVFLSGTPVINNKYELALMYNMLNGLIREYILPIRKKTEKGIVKKDDIEKILNGSSYVDRFTIDTRANKASIVLVPSGFQNKYNAKVYQGLEKSEERLTDESMIDRVIIEFDKQGYRVDIDEIEERIYTIFPDILYHDNPNVALLKKTRARASSYRNMYPNLLLGDRSLKQDSAIEFDSNAVYKATFKDRIQGYTSYYHEITGTSEETGSDLFPEKIIASNEETDVYMSDYQFIHYCTYRMHEQYLEELATKSKKTKGDANKKKAAFSDSDSVAQSFRVFTRQIGLFVFPPNIERPRIKKADFAREFSIKEISVMVKKVLSRYAKEDRYDKLQKLISQFRGESRGVNIAKVIELIRSIYDISSSDIDEWKQIITSTNLDLSKLQFNREEEKIDESKPITETAVEEDVEVDIPIGDQCDPEYGECVTESKQAEDKYNSEYIESIQRLTESNLKTASSLPDGGQSVSNMTLDVLSPKYVKMLENINATPGLVLCYSQFRNIEGVATFSRVLEINGYKRLRLTGVQDKIRKGDLVRYTEGNNVWKTSPVRIVRVKDSDTVLYEVENGKHLDRSEIHPCRFALWTGTETQEERERILRIYNDTTNMYGQQCLILIITQSGAEGISLKNVRQVHVMEPYWNNVRVNQVIGRARRVESHVHLPKEQQNVKIFKYTIQFTPDQKQEGWLKKNIKSVIDYNYDDLINFKKNLDRKLEKGNKDMKQAVEEGKVANEEDESTEKKMNYTEGDKRDFINAVARTIQADKYITSDEELARMSNEKDKTLSEYIQMIKESSVDCHFNREANIRADPDYAKSTCYVNLTGVQRNPYMYDYHMDSIVGVKKADAETEEGVAVPEKATQYVYKIFNYKDPSDPAKIMRLRVLVPELTDIKDIPDGTDVFDDQNNVVGKFVRINGKTNVRLIRK